jgi:hypothetical protein
MTTLRTRSCGAASFRGLLRSAAIAVATGVLPFSLAACSDGSAAPLALIQTPGGISTCMPAPNPAAAVREWNSQIGIALDMYFNQAAMAVTIKSLSLLDSHGLILHGGVMVEMPHDADPLPLAWAWGTTPRSGLRSAWIARQATPGAVIPPGHPSHAAQRIDQTTNVYEIAVDISASTRAGGWALGEVVKYEADGRTYSIRALTGLGVGADRLPIRQSCDAAMSAIKIAMPRAVHGRS